MALRLDRGISYNAMPESNSFKCTPHIHKGRFYNHIRESRQSFLMPSLYMFFECFWRPEKKAGADKMRWYAPHVGPVDSSPSITWIGHSTFLIQAHGVTIITDPVFGNIPLFKRQLPPGILLGDVPSIDYVLISHNHRDHMDERSLLAFRSDPRTHFLVPKGDKAWFDKRGFKNVSEYMWWDQKITTQHGFQLTFTFLPAHHWSQRGIFDFNKSLWGSWMIDVNDSQIYFAGDTAYSYHFEAIAKEFTNIALALMPIGPCEPRKWMSNTHVSAEEAGQAFLDLQAAHFIPMHWGTFNFGTDHHEAPYERIMSWWHKQQFDDKKLTVMKVGQRIEAFEDKVSFGIQPGHESSIIELG